MSKTMYKLRKLGARAVQAVVARNDNGQNISLFDVKELYDAAYAEKAKARVSLKRFKTLIQKAEQLDALYRTQLMARQSLSYGRAA